MADGLRIDKWLWFARICKTRSLVQRMIARGQVSLNGAVVQKFSAPVRPGDVLTLVIGPLRRTLTVRQGANRRGPPAEARRLYDEPNAPEKLDAFAAALPLYL